MSYQLQKRFTRYVILTLAISLTACSLRDLVDVAPPDTGGVVGTDVVSSYSGAIGMYYSALNAASEATSLYTQYTAQITDELRRSVASSTGLDALQLDSLSSSFPELSKTRVFAERVRGALGLYPNQTPAAYIGELFALEGYADVLLAEGFCSGIPLTKARYGEDIEYAAGSSTTEILTTAIALFDSALVHGKDSAAIVTLARVGKGRALLALGEYAGAAEAVADVPTGAVYRRDYAGVGGVLLLQYWSVRKGEQDAVMVVNAEGGNGLSWIAPTVAQQDPRVPLTTTNPIRQAKYPTSGATAQVVASGIEARLIEAEAQLQPAGNPNGPWLATLNALRATLVNATGARLLADTTDPGTAKARIQLLFRERAFWLYLTGHRQGDLRRMIRHYGTYGFSVETVYPQGVYVWQTAFGTYGSVVTLTPSSNEASLNPRYDGCFTREP